MAKSNVLLLKSPSLDIPDPYEDSFRDYGFNPVTVPVLETVFTDLDELKQKILLGPRALGLAGVIITSARACEAWSLALKDVVQQPLAGDHRGWLVFVLFPLRVGINVSHRQLVFDPFLCYW